MKPYIISADSTLDMPNDFLILYDIRSIASYVTMGENTVYDWPNLTQKALLEYVQDSGQQAKLNAANPDDYETWFRKLTAEGRPVIHVSKSSAISPCYQNACLAAKAVENVWVVDSKSLSGGTSLMIHAVLRTKLQAPDEVVAFMEAYRERIEGSFIIETADFLYQNGRCSTLDALSTNILKIHPKLVFRNGLMHLEQKYRGFYHKCVYRYLEEQIAKLPMYETDIVYMNHTIQDPKLVDELKVWVRKQINCHQLIVYPASAAIFTYCGPNALGLFFVRKENNFSQDFTNPTK